MTRNQPLATFTQAEVTGYCSMAGSGSGRDCNVKCRLDASPAIMTFMHLLPSKRSLDGGCLSSYP